MKFLLAAVGFRNGDILYNKSNILKTIKKYSGKADLIVLGEAYLQGFYALNFGYDHDCDIAISINDEIIREIMLCAEEYKVGVSFGFIEKDNDYLYSSQITIDQNGRIIDLYKRISPGWKEYFANNYYKEGIDFHTFKYLNKTFATALCGDLWYEENIEKMKGLNADIVLWPVYTDFNFDVWNNAEKYEYAEQVKDIGKYVLYVNSVCLDKDGEDIAKGGAACFFNGKIIYDLPSGSENSILVEIQ